MKFVALLSGGKDSYYSIHLSSLNYNHQLCAVASLVPPSNTVNEELDSHCFQTIGTHLTSSIAECLEVPYYSTIIKGTSLSTSLEYTETIDDEVEDLFFLLSQVTSSQPDIVAVSSGAILSNYQRLRIEHVCNRLNLISLSYLWQQDQTLLLKSMISLPIDAIIVKVATSALSPDQCGKSIQELKDILFKLNDEGSNVCGEGGEYESLVLDAPLFRKRIIIDESEVIREKGDIAPVGRFIIKRFHLQPKVFSINQTILKEEDDSKSIEQPEKSGRIMDTKWRRVIISKFESLASPLFPLLHLNQSNNRGVFFNRLVFNANNNNTFLSFTEQFSSMLSSLIKALSFNGLTVTDVIYVQLVLPDMSLFADANNIFKSFFSLINSPSRATIAIDSSYMSIECLINKSINRQTLHVQSISNWAPACIGPYSQATILYDIIYHAGMIGLLPATMMLPNDWKAEIQQIFINIRAVLSCLKSSLNHTISAIIYININNYLNITSNLIIECCEMNLCNDKLSLIYLEVGDLPRHAMAELQLISHKSASQILMPECKVNESIHNQYQIILNNIYSESIYSSIVISLYTDISTFPVQYSSKDSDYKHFYEVFSYMINQLLDIQRIVDVSMEDRWFIRVYVDIMYLHMNEVEKIFLEMFQSRILLLPSSLHSSTSSISTISFYPVMGIKSIKYKMEGKEDDQKQILLMIHVFILNEESIQ